MNDAETVPDRPPLPGGWARSALTLPAAVLPPDGARLPDDLSARRRLLRRIAAGLRSLPAHPGPAYATVPAADEPGVLAALRHIVSSDPGAVAAAVGAHYHRAGQLEIAAILAQLTLRIADGSHRGA